MNKKNLISMLALMFSIGLQAQNFGTATPVDGGTVSLDVSEVTNYVMTDNTRVTVFPVGSEQNFTVPNGVSNIKYLVVGGGGGGARGLDRTAGGGAGGRVTEGYLEVTSGDTITISVGAGGQGGSSNANSSSGGNSSLTYGVNTFTAPGGGYGTRKNRTGTNGGGLFHPNSALGSNIRYNNNGLSGITPSYTVYWGGRGSENAAPSFRFGAGGGAGNGGNGGDAYFDSGAGDGGVGHTSTITGESLGYGGGGGGSFQQWVGSPDIGDSYRGLGKDGGGHGAIYDQSGLPKKSAQSGTRGGGGGGGVSDNDGGAPINATYGNGGNGGDGVVVLRYESYMETINYIDYVVLDTADGYSLSQANTILDTHNVKLINGGTLVIDEVINTSNNLIIEANAIDVQANITANNLELYADALTASSTAVTVTTGNDFTYAPYPDGEDEYGFPNNVTWPISNLTLATVPGKLILGEEFDDALNSPTYSGDITINDNLTVGKGLEVFAKNITLDGTTEGGANKTIEVQDSFNGNYYKINLVASQNIYQYNMDITSNVYTYYLANKDESADGGLVHIKGTESNPVVINMLDGKLRIAEVNEYQYLNCSTTPLTIGEGDNAQTLYTAIALENCTITGNFNFTDNVLFRSDLNDQITPSNSNYPAYSMVTAGNVEIDGSSGELYAFANAENDYDQETGAIWFDVLNTNPTVLKNISINYYISGNCAANQYGIKGDFKIISPTDYNNNHTLLTGSDLVEFADDVTAASNWFHPDINVELLNPSNTIGLNFNGPNNNLAAPQGTFLIGYKEGSAVTSSDADFNLVSSAGKTMSFFEDMNITYNATGGKVYFNINKDESGAMVWPLPENINISGTISDLHLKNNNSWSGGIEINEDLILSGYVRLDAGSSSITAQTIECEELFLRSDIEIAAGKHIETGTEVQFESSYKTIRLKANSTQMATIVGTINSNSNDDIIIERPVNGAPGNDLVSHSMQQTQTFSDFISNNPDLVYGGSIGGTPNYYLFGSYDQASRSYLYFNTNGNVYNAETGSHITDGSISTDIVMGRGYRVGTIDANTNGHDIVEFETRLPNYTIQFDTDQTVALTVTELNEPYAGWTTTNNSWNLLGNPFPAYLDMNSILTANQDVLHEESQAIYGYNGNGGWRIFNLATSINKYIAPGQGFFVRGPETEGSNFTFLASAQASYADANNSDDFVTGRSASSTNDVYYAKLLLGNSEQTGDTYLYFLQQGSNGLDAGYDSSTWESQIPEFGIYSNLVENNQGVPMAIQTLNTSALFDQGVTIPLGVETASGIQLTFSLDQLDTQLPDGAVIMLEDTQTNTFTDLATQDYIVQADSDLSGIGRFYIHVGENTTLSNTEVAYQNLQVYAPKGSGTIEISGMVESGMSMQVYDMLGRNVMSTALQATQGTQSVPAGHLTDGAYIVSLNGTKGTRSVKLVITK